ncbi:hypothetical protein [Streptomyces minutiscleroticus]|uniref:hypothetical protein n=1 Tax=Streptomyces minutiscleroticus TaxID=68238 RepID=UPI00167E8986|nr:hypothetical protein [Streptomyces minutiscleroticus]
MRAEELHIQAARIAVRLADAEAVWERRVIDREELVQALAAPDRATVPPAGARAVSAVVEEVLGAGAVMERIRA